MVVCMRSLISLFSCTSYAYNNPPVISVLAFLLIFCLAGIPTDISYVPFPPPIDEWRFEYSKAFELLFLPKGLVPYHVSVCRMSFFHISQVSDSVKSANGTGSLWIESNAVWHGDRTMKGYQVHLNKKGKRISRPRSFSVSWSVLQSF